jgi:cell division septal protein FtsQ
MSTRTRSMRGRKKPTLASRLRVFWILIVIVLAAIAAGIYVLSTLPQLRVRAVNVQIESKRLNEGEILAAARIDRNANAWLLDTAAAEKRIEEIPYVRSAHISRTLPADVSIDVTARVPVACLHSGARIVTIDDAPRILQEGCVDATLARIDLANASLGVAGTIAADPSIGGLVADSHTLAESHIALVSVGRDKFGGLVALDRTGVTLLFGADTDLAQKAALVNPIRASVAKDRRIKSIDLRAPATPIVDFK